MANQPVLTLWEMVGGQPSPVSTLIVPPTNRGETSIVKTLRVYNNKGSSGSAPAKDCRLTITDPIGGDSIQIVQGTPGNGNQPMVEARCLTLSYSSKNELVVTSGSGTTGPFNMLRGANGSYVEGSAVVRQEFPFNSVDNASMSAGSLDLVISDPAIPSGGKIAAGGLPASFTVTDPNGGSPVSRTYYTANATFSYNGDIIVHLDVGEQTDPAPTDDISPFQLSGMYYRELDVTEFTVTDTGDPATVETTLVVASGARLWMDYTYSIPDAQWERIGGALNTMDIGGETDELSDDLSGVDNTTPTIDDDDYAEMEMRFVIPPDATTVTGGQFKIKVNYNWSA